MRSAKPQLVVIGAGAAGDAAVASARASGYDGSVVLVGADRHRAYERPYLSKEYLRDEVPIDRVFLHEPDAYAQMDVTWLGGRRAVGASREAGSVHLDDGSSLHFDQLVLATGGSPRWLPGVPRAANVFTLRTLDDSTALRQAVAESRRLLVIGAGFIGAEVAAAARMMQKEVLLVEIAAVPLGRALGEEMGEVYAAIHRRHGVDLRTRTSVSRWLTRGDRIEAVELAGGAREEVDAVLLAVGIDPELDLARDLGLPLGSGGVLVDAALEAAPGIRCAGDIAAHFHPTFRRHLRVEHWQVARKQGQSIGPALVGPARPYAELPWFWSDQYDVKLEYLGHAPSFDRTVWRGDREGGTFSVFYLEDGLIEAVLAVNDRRTIRWSRSLIPRRRPVDPATLADTATDLRELARSEA